VISLFCAQVSGIGKGQAWGRPFARPAAAPGSGLSEHFADPDRVGDQPGTRSYATALIGDRHLQDTVPRPIRRHHHSRIVRRVL